MNQLECCKKVASRRRVACAIRSPVNDRDLQLDVLESCMKHCMYLFLCVAVRIYYGRKRGLEIGLYRWRTSEGVVRSDEQDG